MNTGRYSLAKLLMSPEIEQIIVPELQRDYVWKKRNVEGLLNSILSNFEGKSQLSLKITEAGAEIDSSIADYLTDEYMRLRFNTRIGFIYAYHDPSAYGQFYLIDGQQRITTLFLLLLAAYSSCNPEAFRRKYFNQRQPKIDYKVREASHRFLVDFIEFTLNNPNGDFKNSEKYYLEYETDETTKSLYNNFKTIRDRISGLSAEKLIDYIENYVEFNYFDTNMSAQGEQLYLYLNSRGEALSDQEKIKAVMVGRAADKLAAGEKWEDWQNYFWRKRNRKNGEKSSDRGFFEFLKWATILHIITDEETAIIKNTAGKSRIANIEDYIRIERGNSDIEVQKYWIFDYITENKGFNIEWVEKVMNAVKSLDAVVQTQNVPLKIGDFFAGYDSTIHYLPFLGSLMYLLEFEDADANNVVRFGMYLKNLKSNINLSKNPDNAVVQACRFVKEMRKLNLSDVRLFKNHINEFSSKSSILRADDMRFEYYYDDLKEENAYGRKSMVFGKWERYFWQITNNDALNGFLRGDHDIIVKLIKKKQLSPDIILARFCKRIFEHRKSDSLRRALLQIGDISIYAGGGSKNLPPNQWMSRWGLLTNDAEESYWDEFLHSPHAPLIINTYLTNANYPFNRDSIQLALAQYVGFMKNKLFLDYRHTGQTRRLVMLSQTQASKQNSHELNVHRLYRKLKAKLGNAWMWEHNFCVINFKKDDSKVVTIPEKDKGYFIDVWFDWVADGGKWYCQIGHKERDLTQQEAELFEEIVGKPVTEGLSNEKKTLRVADAIWEEKPRDEYFRGQREVEEWVLGLWQRICQRL